MSGGVELLLASRGLALAAAMAAFGGLAFERLSGLSAPPPRRLALVAFAASLITACLAAARAGGDELGVVAVLTRTSFGRAALFHCAVAALFAAALQARARGRALELGLAALTLASFAPLGHAAAAVGMERFARLTLQSIHLLAGGFWLGGLPPFIGAMHSDGDSARRAVMVFKNYGPLVAGLILVTGLANTLFLAGTIPPPIAHAFGRFWLTKLALFLSLLALGGYNRWIAAPQRDRRRASGVAMVELVLFALVVLVAVNLAQSPPHELHAMASTPR